jgi:hypothetical protein
VGKGFADTRLPLEYLPIHIVLFLRCHVSPLASYGKQRAKAYRVSIPQLFTSGQVHVRETFHFPSQSCVILQLMNCKIDHFSKDH